jgi:hypothetical protein
LPAAVSISFCLLIVLYSYILQGIDRPAACLINAGNCSMAGLPDQSL